MATKNLFFYFKRDKESSLLNSISQPTIDTVNSKVAKGSNCEGILRISSFTLAIHCFTDKRDPNVFIYVIPTNTTANKSKVTAVKVPVYYSMRVHMSTALNNAQ